MGDFIELDGTTHAVLYVGPAYFTYGTLYCPELLSPTEDNFWSGWLVFAPITHDADPMNELWLQLSPVTCPHLMGVDSRSMRFSEWFDNNGNGVVDVGDELFTTLHTGEYQRIEGMRLEVQLENLVTVPAQAASWGALKSLHHR